MCVCGRQTPVESAILLNVFSLQTIIFYFFYLAPENWPFLHISLYSNSLTPGLLVMMIDNITPELLVVINLTPELPGGVAVRAARDREDPAR
jgi:hypothetical protein